MGKFVASMHVFSYLVVGAHKPTNLHFSRLLLLSGKMSRRGHMLVEQHSRRSLCDLFWDACKHGDEAKVNAAITLGVDINIRNSNGDTGLILATRNNQEGIVDILLADPNIDVNVKAHSGTFALAVAADIGSDSIVAKLAKMPQLDVDRVNDRAANGWPPLYIATYRGIDQRNLS